MRSLVSARDAGKPVDCLHRLDGAFGENVEAFFTSRRLLCQLRSLFHKLADLLVMRPLEGRDVLKLFVERHIPGIPLVIVNRYFVTLTVIG